MRTKNGDIYVIETKGGGNSNDQDKNIDRYAPAKYEALKEYTAEYNVKWAFIRDMNEGLYYRNDGTWIDDINRVNNKDRQFKINGGLFMFDT